MIPLPQIFRRVKIWGSKSCYRWVALLGRTGSLTIPKLKSSLALCGIFSGKVRVTPDLSLMLLLMGLISTLKTITMLGMLLLPPSYVNTSPVGLRTTISLLLHSVTTQTPLSVIFWRMRTSISPLSSSTTTTAPSTASSTGTLGPISPPLFLLTLTLSSTWVYLVLLLLLGLDTSVLTLLRPLWNPSTKTTSLPVLCFGTPPRDSRTLFPTVIPLFTPSRKF